MGDDTIYSGTVAAATEGFLLGIPSFAMSLTNTDGGYYETAARVAAEMVERFRARPIGQPVLLNVNVPDVPFEALAGISLTRLGRRHKAQPAVTSRDPRGNVVYWVGAAGNAQDAGEGTDFLRRGAEPSLRDTAADGPHALRAARRRARLDRMNGPAEPVSA